MVKITFCLDETDTNDVDDAIDFLKKYSTKDDAPMVKHFGPISCGSYYGAEKIVDTIEDFADHADYISIADIKSISGLDDKLIPGDHLYGWRPDYLVDKLYSFKQQGTGKHAIIFPLASRFE